MDEPARVLLRSQRLLYDQTARLIRSLWDQSKAGKEVDIGQLTYDLFTAAQTEAGRLWEVWHRAYRMPATGEPTFRTLTPMEKPTEPRQEENHG